MLKPKQLSVAKTVVDSLLQASSEETRKPVQVTRWDGTDTTAFLTSTGCIFIGWFGRPSSKMSPDPNWYTVPKDWDKAEVVNNALTADSSDNCWPIGPDKERANKIISSLLTGSRGKPWSGVRLESLCKNHEGYKFVVCHKHTVFFIWRDKAPGKSAVWANSISELPNVIFAVNDNVNHIMQAMYDMDNESRVLITQHSSGAVLMHIVSEEFRTEVHFVLPYASVFDGKEVWLSTTMKTTAVRKSVFDDIVNKNTDNKEEKEMSDAVSMSDLNAIMGGESKKEEKKAAVSKVETTQKEGSLKKPEKEENPPWEEAEAKKSPAVTQTSGETKLGDTITVEEYKKINDTSKVQEEPAVTVAEELECLSSQVEELLANLSDVTGRVKYLKASVKLVAKRYKAESKTIKRSAEDSKKLEDYDRLSAQLAKFKKLLAE